MTTVQHARPLESSPSRNGNTPLQVSPSRTETAGSTTTFGSSIRSAFQRALSPNRDQHSRPGLGSDRRQSFGSKMSQLDDGRGRQPIVSTGRGGAGNLVRSPSRGVERGREVRDASIDRMIHSGRGGAGNIRSPSRGPQAAIQEEREDALQARLVAEERGRQVNANFSTGRGGAGNISRSKSRSRSAVRDAENGSIAPSGHSAHHDYRSGGRGGWGNIREDAERDSIAEQKDAAAASYEADVRAKHTTEEADKLHSHGHGGLGNMSHGAPPPAELSQMTPEEREAYAKVHAHDGKHGVSTGRGGPGNIHRHILEGEDRGRNGEKGVLGSVLRSLSRATGREKSSDRAKGD